MPIVAIQGLRGGTGATTLTAALSWALNALGETVIALDLSPINQLRIHFNTPFALERGWAHATLNEQDWQQGAMRYQNGLDFIPYGSLNVKQQQTFSALIKASSQSIINDFVDLKNHYRWVLLDVPAEPDEIYRGLLNQADRLLRIINADANCHLRLYQQSFTHHTLFLLNQFNASSKMQQDLHQIWIDAVRNMIPVLVHRDEAMAESLLKKQPVGEYRPGSLAAEEITILANWLLMHVQERES